VGDLISEVPKELNITPVLVDVGASGQPPEIWNDLAENSISIGFDPNLRHLYSPSGIIASLHNSVEVLRTLAHRRRVRVEVTRR
jgi:hypothetical protein